MHSRRRQQVNRFTVPTPPPSTLPPPFPLYSNFPFLFLSPPPGGSRTIPHGILLPFVLFSFFRSWSPSYLLLTFQSSVHRVALEYRLLVRPSHYLPFSTSLRAAIFVMRSSVAPTFYLFPSTARANMCPAGHFGYSVYSDRL